MHYEHLVLQHCTQGQVAKDLEARIRGVVVRSMRALDT